MGRKSRIEKIPLGKLIRFALTGAVSALIYSLSTHFYSQAFAVSAAFTSGMGYATAIPCSFLAHRHLTFEAKGKLSPQFVRFCATHLLGFLLSIAIVWLITDLWGWNIWIGMIITIILIPIISYLLMDKWVFGKKYSID